MPSRTIRPTQAPAPAPFAYTIGTADGLAPEAVFAAWDGSGAGGDFLPCVSYYSAEGVLLDRAFPDSGAVTAGDTAEVSYRPFKRGGGGGGGTPLVVTDGTTTVSPTTELLAIAGLVVFDFGGGIAAIETRPAEWATARLPLAPHTNPTGNQFGPAAPVPLNGVVANGIDATNAANGVLTIERTGLYLVTITGAQTTTADNSPAIMRVDAPLGSFQAPAGPILPGSVGGNKALVYGSGTIYAAGGDSFQLLVYDSTGVSCTVAEDLQPGYSLVRVGD